MSRLTKDEAHSLWRRWKHDGDHHAREQLILAYRPLVKHLAAKAVAQLPSHVDTGDFISCGMVALVAAVDRFDPDKGAPFEQFVWTRINGAMLDECRSQDWATRGARRSIREVERASDRWFMRHGRMPRDSELAAELGITVRKLRDIQMDVARADTLSMNAPVANSELNDIIEVIDTIEDVSADPCQIVAARDALRRAIACLPERERYVFGRTIAGDDLPTIGAVMGLSDTRVCQLRRRIIDRMQEEMAAA